MLEDAEEFVCHFRFRPQKRLQTLHPLEVRKDHATSVTENIRDHENFVPAVFENQVCVRRSRTVGSFGKDSAFELAGIFAGNYAIDRRRNKHVARQSKEFLWIDMVALSKRPQISLLERMLFGRLNVYSLGIVNRGIRVADP